MQHLRRFKPATDRCRLRLVAATASRRLCRRPPSWRPAECAGAFRALSSSGQEGTIARDAKGSTIDFTNPRVAFDSKGTLELFRTWFIFKVCSIGPIVRNCEFLYTVSVKILGSTITHWCLRHTFFNHFCAGESVDDLKPRTERLRKLGVGGILDYAAEAKDETPPATEPQMKEAAPMDVDREAEAGLLGAPISSRTYDYRGEVICDANAEIFLDAVRAVKQATPDGFAAIKLSGLGNPVLLERMSTCLVEMTRLFRKLSRGGQEDDSVSKEPYFMMSRPETVDFPTFREGWKKYFNASEDNIKALFDKMDGDKDGFINYLDWGNGLKLSEINKLVRSCVSKGPLYAAALDDNEMKLYFALTKRAEKILGLAQELDVRVMVDAEWMDIQPAIDHIVLFMQREFNRGDRPVVFNTYQCYLKGMDARVLRDLTRSSKEGWRFGAKLVRGAYVVSEREKAAARGVESPICNTYKDTEANYHKAIDLIMAHKAPDGGITEALMATHNRGSIEHALRRMDEHGKSKNEVYFGQLLGMADHLTFTLGAHGYKAYKYIPYGPINEVIPYLIRRTQENSAILGSPGVQEERRMVTRELIRRITRI